MNKLIIIVAVLTACTDSTHPLDPVTRVEACQEYHQLYCLAAQRCSPGNGCPSDAGCAALEGTVPDDVFLFCTRQLEGSTCRGAKLELSREGYGCVLNTPTER